MEGDLANCNLEEDLANCRGPPKSLADHIGICNTFFFVLLLCYTNSPQTRYKATIIWIASMLFLAFVREILLD